MSQTLITNIKQLVGILPPNTHVLRGHKMDHVESLSNAWLLIEGERIKDFGPMDQVPDLDASTTRLDASDRLVLPAYVDSHSHLVFAGTREDEFEMRLRGMTYEQIAANGGGILNSADKLANASEEELFQSALTRLKSLVEMGTGAIEIKSGYGLSVEGELKMLRVIKRLKSETDVDIKATFLGLHAIPIAYKDDPDSYVNIMINEALPIIENEDLADYVDVFCEQGYFTIDQSKRIIEAARKYGLKPKIHVNQFYAFGGIELGIDQNAISVDHLEVMNDDEFEKLAKSDTIATLLPLCSFFIDIPYGPAKKLIEHHVPVALATDYNPGSSPSGNMQLVQSLACINMKITPGQAFNASTINGAAAIEMGHELGSITRGKKANLLITKEINSLGYLVYNFGHNHIEKVILRGRLQG